MALFDAADPNGVTSVRNETTVASQSLFMLNSLFVREQAKGLADQLFSDQTTTDLQRIERAHQLAFCRMPTQEEASEAMQFLQAYQESTVNQNRPPDKRVQEAWQSYCQSLLCSNEFLYTE